MGEIRKQFKVTGIYKENTRSYYTVNHKGEEYFVQMLPYQIERGGMPNMLNCIIKDEKGSLRIMQDVAFVIEELYHVGQTDTFTIKEKPGGYYVVKDRNGLLFRLTEFGDKTLLIGQSVKAKVIDVNLTKVCLSLVEEEKSEESIPFIRIQQISENIGLSEEEQKDFEELLGAGYMDSAKALYDAKDGKWILTALSSLDERLLCDDDFADDAKKYIDIIQKLCIYAIEGSVILKRLTAQERKDWISKISVTAQHAEDFKEAYKIHDAGESETYISRQLDNLKESEYLYQPERKLRIIMCLLNLDTQLMLKMIDRLFSIIIEGNKENWRSEPFRSAFVNMLEIFITEYRFKAIRSAGVELIHQMIRAIAIQQMLSNAEDDIDRRLNRATYYRLLAYMGRSASFDILNDAFDSLFSQYQENLEYDWDDIISFDALYMKAAYKIRTNPENRQRQRYIKDNIELLIDSKGVIIQQTNGIPFPIDASKILPWQNIDIKVNGNLTAKKKLKDLDKLDVVTRLWDCIDKDLWEKTTTQRKNLLCVDDTVNIKVISSNKQHDSLLCEIVSPQYEGKGWLDIEETVSYLQKDKDIEKLFQDGNGNPLLLEVTVIDDQDEDGFYAFSMVNQIDGYHQAIYEKDAVMECSIRSQWTDIDTGIIYEVGVSVDGASCLITKEEGRILQKGDFVKVRASGMFHNEQFICDFLSMSDIIFTVGNAVNTLMKTISKDDELEEEVLDDTMDLAAVKEIIGILDRQSVISDTRSLSYSYLAVAYILSKIICDSANIEYYDKRKKIIVATEEYERNGYVDDQKLSKLLDSIGNDLIQSDYQINEAVTKFRILQSLKHKENVHTLFNISTSAKNTSVRNAADLAISLLLTDRFEIPNISRLLRDRIYQEIGVKIKDSKLRDFGIETQTQEFKSSMVYPPNNGMRPNKTLQGSNIMKVICSFLNSDEGGTLYFGVNKTGASCGIENDLKYLETDEDGYGRYIHNLINRELGTIANQCCTKCTWEEDAGYKIYVMAIAPAPELIRYKGDIWIRQDTEKRILPAANVEKYEQMHKVAYEKYIASSSINSEPESDSKPVVTKITEKPQEVQEIKSSSLITSRWRKNIVEPWDEECGIETSAFIHFLSNWKYKVTDNAIYDETDLSLAIHESETNGFIAIGYESGKILVVDTEDILDKSRNKNSSRCQTENPIFACPAHKNDGIMSIWRSAQGELMARVDIYENLVDCHCNGAMTDSGMPIQETKNKGVVTYEIVPENVMQKFQKYRNKGIGLGVKLTDKEKTILHQLLKIEL